MKNKLTLKTLVVTNFKGTKHFVLDANSSTNVYGKNGTGKTSLVDAYRWLLIGKNSNDQTTFEIKPVDKDGNRAQKTENEVSGIFDFNGKEVTLRRVHREKWVIKKGAEEPVFTGNETAYFWNDVPLKESEYKAKVSEMIDEGILKLLSDTVYFNSLKWQDRRSELTKIAGTVTDEDILNDISSLQNKSEIAILTSIINSSLTFEEKKKEIGAKKLKSKNELKDIPSRIDEVTRSLPDVSNIQAVEDAVLEVKGKISALDDQITDSNKAYEAKELEVSSKRKEIFQLKLAISDIENGIRLELTKSNSGNDNKKKELADEIQQLKAKQNTLENSINTHQASRTNNIRRIGELGKIVESRNQKLSDLKNQWVSENSKQLIFEEGAFDCPCCSRPLEQDNIEEKQAEMVANFANGKKNQLEIIVKNAEAEKGQLGRDVQEIETLGTENESKNALISTLNSDLSSIVDSITVIEDKIRDVVNVSQSTPQQDIEVLISDSLSAHKEHIKLKARVKELESEVSEFKSIDHSEIVTKKTALQEELNGHNASISKKEQVKAGNDRIAQLKAQEASLSQAIAKYEHEEYVIQLFLSRKISLTENRINELFSFVQFRMFDKTIEGNVFDVCDTLINGVPYNDANTASKINAGIEIINVLSNFYGFSAPVWIDNRESITDIIPTQHQVISLIVSPGHDQLTIN